MFKKKIDRYDKSGDSYTTQLTKTNTFLVNILMALFHKSYLEDKGTVFEDRIIATLKEFAPSSLFSDSITGRVNNHLIDLIEDILRLGSKTPISYEWLEIKLEPLALEHGNTIHHILNKLEGIGDLSKESIENRYSFYLGLIYKFQSGFLLKKKAKEAFARTLNCNDEEIANVLTNLIEEIKPMLVVSDVNHKLEVQGLTELVNTGDVKELEEKFKNAKVTVDPASILRTNLQGINNSLSVYGGAERGQFIEIQAASGNSKSDTARYLLRGVAMNNTPYMFDKEKLPALVYISTEETTERSIALMVKQMRREEGDCYELEDWDDEQTTAYFTSKMESRGYKIFFAKAKAKELTSTGVVNILEGIKEMGYEIHMAMVDYMGYLSLDDIKEENMSEAIKTTFVKIFDYTNSNRITFIALSQIAGGDYGKVFSEERDIDDTKTMVHQNLSSFSKNIINVIDTRVLIKLVKGSNGSYYQWAVGKNRMGGELSPEEKYCVYTLHSARDSHGKYRPSGFIMPDINKDSKALRATPDITLNVDDLGINGSTNGLTF